MKTDFKVLRQLKTDVHKKYHHTRKGLCAVSSGLILTMIVFSVVFSIYAFLIPGTCMEWDLVYGYTGRKDYMFIWFFLIGGDFILGMLWCFQNMGMYRISGKYISERVNESVRFLEDHFEYGYQNFADSSDGDRVIIRVKYEGLEKIEINREIRKIVMTGMVSSVYYEDYRSRQTCFDPNDFKHTTFTIFDYFEPGLIDYLDENYADLIEEVQ